MFDLDLLEEFAAEQGLQATRKAPDTVVVQLGGGYALCFENWPEQDDTGIFFEGSDGGWHSHGELFLEEGGDIGLVPVDVLQGLLDGALLVARTEFPSGVVEIALQEAGAPCGLHHMEAGEQVTFFRVPAPPPSRP